MITVRTIRLGLLACSTFLLCSCGSKVIATPPNPLPDVYLAGFEVTGNFLTATYWKNGVPVELTARTVGSVANAIVVSGNDIYVGGAEMEGSKDVVMIWKNGVPTTLTDGTKQGFVNSIFVSGTDVYAAGGEEGFDASGNLYGVAEYWKNGVPVLLTDSTAGAQANSIFVSGTDVYVAGFETQTTQTGPSSFNTEQVATYWKNGVPVALTNGAYSAMAYSIAVLEATSM